MLDASIWNEWVRTRPAGVRAFIAVYLTPCAFCYRMEGNEGHYRLVSIAEPLLDDDPCTVTLLHGADSYLAGFAVFGIPGELLVPCDCGDWEEPSDEDIARSKLMVAALAAAKKEDH